LEVILSSDADEVSFNIVITLLPLPPPQRLLRQPHQYKCVFSLALFTSSKLTGTCFVPSRLPPCDQLLPYKFHVQMYTLHWSEAAWLGSRLDEERKVTNGDVF
jgi:hypothetical protein